MADKSFWDAAFSSEKGEWDTDPRVIEGLRPFFPWDIDACAERPNVCENYYSPKDNGLLQPWRGLCWCNPPYGRVIPEWMEKAAQESREGATVVCLVPSRTDTKWWQKAAEEASLIVFIKGRLKFGDQANSAPFPSAFIVFGELSREQGLCLSGFGWTVSQQFRAALRRSYGNGTAVHPFERV